LKSLRSFFKSKFTEVAGVPNEDVSGSEPGLKILVVGKAKTGTTYLSKLIQHSLPDCRYQMEPKDPKFLFDLYADESNDNLVTKIIFEHWDKSPNVRMAMLMDELPFVYNKKILIVRDPRDELVSRLLYIVKPLKDQGKLTGESLTEWLGVLNRKEESPGEVSLDYMITSLDRIFGTSFLDAFTRHLTSFSAFFRAKPRSLFAIRYEDVVDGKLDRLEEYLDFKIQGDVQHDAYIKQTKRSGGYGDWRRFFTQEDVENLAPIMQEYMSQIGYSDWNLDTVEKLDSRTVSEYVKSLTKR